MNKNVVSKSAIILAIVVLIVMVVACVSFGMRKQGTSNDDLVTNDNGVIDYVTDNSGDVSGELGNVSGDVTADEVYLGPNIFSGDARPIAVMIDNEKPAWVNHGGLNKAYMLYEFIIEGGETRIMAFFKGIQSDYIGPVRSARHYFLDYAMEHDAIFTHFGWSPLAQSDIKSLGINNINGIFDTFYWRVPPKSSYHNAITNMEKILAQISRKKYRDTSEAECVVKYNRYDTDIESGEIANYISVKYSARQNVSYEYDAENKVYLRSMRGQVHKDSQTGEQFYAKNIIMIHVRDELLDDPEDKGRRNLYNVGSGKGYYATNGMIEPITWKKADRKSKTVYYDKDGNELSVNDGITWVQVVPMEGSITWN